MEYSEDYHIALLMCVAMGEYHSEATNDWSENGKVIPIISHPLLYTTTTGVYTCTVTSNQKSLKCSFEIIGILLCT